MLFKLNVVLCELINKIMRQYIIKFIIIIICSHVHLLILKKNLPQRLTFGCQKNYFEYSYY